MDKIINGLFYLTLVSVVGVTIYLFGISLISITVK